MPSTISILTAINSTAPVTWSQFVHKLPDRPRAYTERSIWREVLTAVQTLEDMELITVVRDRNSNDVLSLALTPLGLERLRESNEADRMAIERRRNRIELDRGVRRRYV